MSRTNPLIEARNVALTVLLSVVLIAGAVGIVIVVVAVFTH